VLQLFGQHGWVGVTLDAVAIHVGIGMSTIYLRWSNKRDLLLEGVRDFGGRHVGLIDDGQSLRDYLIGYCIAYGGLLLSPYASTTLNIASAAIANPEDLHETRHSRARGAERDAGPTGACGAHQGCETGTTYGAVEASEVLRTGRGVSGRCGTPRVARKDSRHSAVPPDLRPPQRAARPGDFRR